MSEKLFTEFPPISKEEWESILIKELKGADYNKTLVWKTLEGFECKPYYRNEDFLQSPYKGCIPEQKPFIRGYNAKDNNWEISQEIYIESPKLANVQALDALKKGAHSVTFVTQEKTHSHVCYQFEKQEELSLLLKGIDLEKTPLRFIAGRKTSIIISMIEEEIVKQKLDASKVKIVFDYDPIDYLTIKGRFFAPEDQVFNQTASLVKYAEKTFPVSRIIGINGYLFHNAGTTLVQELAYSLSIASEYLSILSEKGLELKTIAKHFTFNFGVSSNYFLEIAKLRAARILYDRMIGAFIPGENAIQMNIHSITSDFNKTAYDPHVNLLRNTTEAMSAILGGTQSLTVRPFDAIYTTPGDLSQRLARNIQILLKEEVHLDKVADPAGGSYYIESLTQNMVEHAWKLFLEIEDKGGYIKAFKEGYIQKQVKEIQNKRILSISQRSEILLGINQYPNTKETIKENISKTSGKKEISDKEIIAEPINTFRGSEAFEQLRLQTEEMKHTPKVFLFTFGSLAFRKARAFFTSNFFGCAGFEIIDNPGFATIEDGIAAAKASKAEIVVICSSDEEYVQIVAPIATALKNETIVVLAGYPKDMIETYKTQGIEQFIHVRSNVLESLQNFQKIIISKKVNQ